MANEAKVVVKLTNEKRLKIKNLIKQKQSLVKGKVSEKPVVKDIRAEIAEWMGFK